jgi:WD40 repeat protein
MDVLPSRLLLCRDVQVLAVAYSPPNRDSFAVELYDTNSWKPVGRATGAGTLVDRLGCDAGNRTVIAGNGSILEFSGADAKLLRSVESEKTMTSLAVSPNGKLLALVTPNEVRVLQYPSLEPVATARGLVGPLESVVFAPNGRYLAVSGLPPRLWSVWSREGRPEADKKNDKR